ncbi:MAG: hypothetical protein R3B13_38610 [Polyangiaceae bacterium]
MSALASAGRFGPWLFGARLDLALFGGSALLALGLVLGARVSGLSPGPLPEWAWIVCVLGVDVAHVWSTLFRTYLDGEELRRHPARYGLLPVAVYLLGVLAYQHGAMTFWRILAYVAVFHFVRQQVGWVAVYRARAGGGSRADRIVDDAAVYAATLYPILYWHAHLAESRIAWFMPGDFVDATSALLPWLPGAQALWALALAAFAIRQVAAYFRTRVFPVGKTLVVATTAATWYVGIVAANNDFDFTVTNVLVHGIPYVGLLWVYARERGRVAPRRLGSQIVAGGVGAFLLLLLILAFVEELAWDRWVWHERQWLFGGEEGGSDPSALTWLIPLLSVPQATHYALDGILWRRGDSRARAAQRAAFGMS